MSLVLSGSAQSLTATLSGSVNVDYTSSALLSTSPGTASPVVKQGQITDTTITAIVAAPADGVFATVGFLSLRNVGSTTVSVTIKKKVSSTYYSVTPLVPLLAGETLQFTPSEGFIVLNTSGVRKDPVLAVNPTSTVRTPVAGRGAGIAAVKELTGVTAATNVYAYYLGKATVATTSVIVKTNVTTAATATIAATELAIATGTPGAFSGVVSTLTVKGYADTSAVWNATGLKVTTVTLTTGINAGDDVWVLFMSCTSGTAPILSAFEAGDVLRANCTGVISGASSAVRPSTVLLDTPTVFTTEAAATLPVWCAVSGL